MDNSGTVAVALSHDIQRWRREGHLREEAGGWLNRLRVFIWPGLLCRNVAASCHFPSFQNLKHAVLRARMSHICSHLQHALATLSSRFSTQTVTRKRQLFQPTHKNNIFIYLFGRGKCLRFFATSSTRHNNVMLFHLASHGALATSFIH